MAPAFLTCWFLRGRDIQDFTSAWLEPTSGLLAYRVMLGIATAGDGSRSMQTFGVTVDRLGPAETIVIDQ